ncbi:hypothetical protein BDV32DRAFT_146227 [Aspergillus pseudonomiae]|nr:hypothetical protein BDV32DRAFT_146227 [Aspergillus pseudonomiae]
MKIQLLLSFMTLGLALGEPIPKQALSQRQTDNTCPKMSCTEFSSRRYRLSEYISSFYRNAYHGKVSDDTEKQVEKIRADIKKLEACRPKDCGA